MDMEQKPKVKVHILKVVGPYMPGQEVEVDQETALHLCDGIRAVSVEDYAQMMSAQKDPSKMSVKQMQELGIKNVPVDQVTLAKTEAAALAGKPVASGEPITVTGGVTPPTMVFPAMAEAQGHPYTDAKDVKPAKKDEKKDDKKPEQKPEAKK